MFSSKWHVVLVLCGVINSACWADTQSSRKVNSSKDVKEPCIFREEALSASCIPCTKDKWLEMVKPSDEGGETILNSEKTCFNDNPITVSYGDEQHIADGTTVMATGKYTLSQNNYPRSVVLRKRPFFRYAYLPDSSSDETGVNTSSNGTGGTASNSTANELYLDLDSVKKYYRRNNTAGEEMNADFQMIEWPGASASDINKQLNSNSEKLGMSCNGKDNGPNCKNNRKWMLNFERDSGKILHYPCNAQDGVDIVAIGAIANINVSLDKSIESGQKIWLSYGNQSIYDEYVQPLYVPQYILEEMAKPEEPNSNEKLNKPTCDVNQEFIWDLRTVMDFTFTRDRLILGMKCGILLVKFRYTFKGLTYKVSWLRSKTGFGLNLFPGAMNKVSASTCCLNPVLCGKEGGLVAAYSFDRNREVGVDRFIYVSFDYGDIFETKFISSSNSPINLIKGLYKLYEQWHDYYEILHNPDQDDLDDDDDDDDDDKNSVGNLLKTLRSKPVWHTSVTEEKEKLFSIGASSGKKKASLQKIVAILEKRVPKRRERRLRKGDKEADLTPEWVTNIMMEVRKQKGWNESWTDENCDDYEECTEKFENDPAIDWLLNVNTTDNETNKIFVKTPRRDENEPFCKELTSMLLITEERHIMALCEVGFEKLEDANKNISGESDQSVNKSASEFGYFALFNFPIKENLPLIYGSRVSQRVFTCKFIKNTQNPDNEFIIQPEIVRIEGTPTIFVINCDGVIFLSTNFGSTLFNTAFYYEQEAIDKYCNDPRNSGGGGGINGSMVTPTPSVNEGSCEDEKNRPPDESPRYLRTLNLCALNVPPLLATDASGYILLITFGKFYAHGAIAYNTETRLSVGETLHEMEYKQRFENLMFPYVDRNGETVLTISLAQAYSIPATKFRTNLYDKKHGLRLIYVPFWFSRDARNFDNSNLAMCKSAKQKMYGFPVCKVSSYSIYPKRLDMDIDEQESVQVEVIDEDPFLPLWIFSSNENSLEVKAYHSLREGAPIPNLNYHNWKVEITAKPNNKSLEGGDPFVDAFFGSDYSKLNEFSTQISFVSNPSSRCHVTPSSTIDIQISCKGKRMVAYEDKYRPQCKYFRENFNYTLASGKYDPNLANSWIHTSSNQSRSFFKINQDGDLIVTYDYVSWGCPLEPFQRDPFIPDLRIVEENTQDDTTTMTRFTGKFILIELFGAKGFRYSKQVKDLKCSGPPQYLPEQIESWKIRQRLFDLASERLNFPRTRSQLDRLNYTTGIGGNKILKNEEVMRHINIWNRANYINYCQNDDDDDDDDDDHEAIPNNILNRQYQVMKGRDIDDEDFLDEFETENLEQKEDESDDLAEEGDSMNELIWGKDHPRVLLFLAVAVDDYNSLCDYNTIFAVSLQTTPDMNDLHNFLVFLSFLFLWLALVVGGYHLRKRYLRRSYFINAKNDKLEQAAWSIIYRYEKLIHGSTMDALFQNAEGKENPASAKINIAARSVHDKRQAEIRMKKTHIMAQEQARHERLQKLFQKQ